jgi:hypothetical protein
MGKIETEGFVPTIFLMLIYVFINNNLLEWLHFIFVCFFL